MSMRVGVIFGFRNPEGSGEDWGRFYGQALELVDEIDELGYDAVWLSEHHFAADGYCPSVLAVAAAIAARTRRVRIGTNVVVLPIHHPLRIAEDGAIVDAISAGRFELGVGAGYREEEFGAFGVPLSSRAGRLGEGIELIRRAWTEPAVDFAGEHFQVDGLAVRPQPVQSPPPIWIGARAKVATRRAGRIGDGFIISRGREQVRWFCEAAEEAGRDPDALGLATIRVVHVADTREQALAEIGDGLLYHENGYTGWLKKADDLESDKGRSGFGSVADLPVDNYVLGDPDTVVEQLSQLQHDYGFNELILWGRLPGVPWEVTRRSLRRISAEVLPRLRAAELRPPSSVAKGAIS